MRPERLLVDYQIRICIWYFVFVRIESSTESENTQMQQFSHFNYERRKNRANQHFELM